MRRFREDTIKYAAVWRVLEAYSSSLFEYVGAIPVQRLSQVLQQHIQGLVGGLLQQGGAQALVNHSLQILSVLHTVRGG